MAPAAARRRGHCAATPRAVAVALLAALAVAAALQRGGWWPLWSEGGANAAKVPTAVAPPPPAPEASTGASALLDRVRGVLMSTSPLDPTAQMDMIAAIVSPLPRGGGDIVTLGGPADAHVDTPARPTEGVASTSESTSMIARAQGKNAAVTTTMATLQQQQRPRPGSSPPAAPAGAPMCTPAQMRTRLVSATTATGPGPLLADRRYNAGCPTIGRNYRCRASKEHREYVGDQSRRQVPEAAANGSCALAVNSGRFPLPDNSRVLFWGNSHLREILHAIACQFPDAGAVTRGTDQDEACSVDDYKIANGHGEILWETKHGNNATLYGVCNCGLMYDRTTALDNVARVIGVDYALLTHVVANPANVAKWAVDWKYKACKSQPWHQRLAALSTNDKFQWTPFAKPEELGAALRARGFRGKLVWTLPFWCKSNRRLNRYRWPPPPGLVEGNEFVDAVVDFSEYICPDATFRCDVAGCSRGASGGHQCLPGPPDDIASAVLHLLATL